MTSPIDPSFVTLAIEGTANILAALTDAKILHNLEQEPVSASQKSAIPGELATLSYVASNKVQFVVSKSQDALHTLLKAEVRLLVPGEGPYIQNTTYLYAQAGRYEKLSAFNNMVQGRAEQPISTGRFQLPLNMHEILGDQNGAEVGHGGCFESHDVTYASNPYVYSKDLENKVSSEVVTLKLFSCSNQQELSVHGLKQDEEIDMHIPHKLIDKEESPPDWIKLEKHVMNSHQFNVSQEDIRKTLQLHVTLDPVHQGRLFPIVLLLSIDRPPSPSNYFYHDEFPAGQDVINIVIDPGTLQAGHTYYVGLSDAAYNAGRQREGEVQVRYYRFNLWWAQCLYWDTRKNNWSDLGCHMTSQSTDQFSGCRCSHLTSFASQLLSIDSNLMLTNIDEFFSLQENPVSFTLVIIAFIIYILLLVCAVRLDAHDSKKRVRIHLVDNKPGDKFTYAVTLETGFRKGAGTTAKVCIILHGQDGISETRELISETGSPLFERNSRDTFILTFNQSLGPIWKVQLWHNNAGVSPSWYLSRVLVKDVLPAKVYYFNCEKWFAVTEDDGKVEREIYAAEKPLGFSKILYAKGTQYLADYHTWLSVVSRPSYSRFTRAQRLTCSLSLLTSFMALNAVWYKLYEKEYRGEYSLVDVSWHPLVIGIVSSLIVLPPHLLIMFLFRRSKVRLAEWCCCWHSQWSIT